MRPRPVSLDHRVAKALSSPVRAQALQLIATGVASPKAIAKALDLDVRHVSYHVRVLHELGCIELVETHQRRGAIEHVYCVTERATEEG